MRIFLNKNFVKHSISLLGFFAASIYITFPLIFNLGNLSTGVGDEWVMAWIQNWDIHVLTTNPFSIFNANLYFPFHNTLAYAESLIFTSILALPIHQFIDEPIATVNFTFIFSLTFLGFSLYLLAYYLTKNYFLSLLAGVLVIFSPAVLDYAAHMQILAVEWFPLAILFFLQFIKTSESRYLIFSLLFFVFQVYNSFMPGYFIAVTFLVIYIFKLIYTKKQALKLVTKKNIFFALTSIVLIIPVISPYYQVSREFNYVRDIRDAVHFAMQPEDLLYPSVHTRLNSFFISLPFNKHSQNGEFKPGYIGLIFSILSLITLYYFFRQFRKKKNMFINLFVCSGLLGLILSLGPVLHLGRQTIHQPFLIPLPYSLFYYILPGFNGFRNSARWEMLFILSMSIAVVLVLNQLFKKITIKKQILIIFVLIFSSIIEFNYPMKFFPIPQKKDFPPIYQWLNHIPKDSAVIIMPIYNWNMPYVGDEIRREYFSTMNFRKTVNGYTSFSPPPWQKLLGSLHEKFPQDNSVAMIKNIGVEYIVVDKEGYDKNFRTKNLKVDGTFVINSLKKNPSLKLIKKVEDYYVFKYN